MQSKEMTDVYSTREPQLAFHQRISFCLDIHNMSVKVGSQHTLRLLTPDPQHYISPPVGGTPEQGHCDPDPDKMQMSLSPSCDSL